MTICIFLGPTLLSAEACEILDAVYLPPARRGDVMAAIREHRPHTLAIVDGYFEQVPSVWHKELLWALSRGVRVLGAASMGAIRAAELTQFGMEGVGKIFQAYNGGRFEPFDEPFEDDDEVAVVHGPEEMNYLSSEAMVDIRATLIEAKERGVIDEIEMLAIASAAKALFYKRRTWETVLEAAVASGLSASSALDLGHWVPDNKVLQKRQDALELFDLLRGTAAVPQPPRFRFERTLLWESAAMNVDAMEPQ